jgi:hypothetical protein
VFPQVYRVTGFAWAFEDPVAETGLVPDTNFPVVYYTLADTEGGSLSTPRFEPIEHLDSSVDRGWVIVRHHPSEARMQGFLDGYSDTRDPGFDQNPGAIVYWTNTGIFTCVHRPAAPKQPDRLMIFIALTVVSSGPAAGLQTETLKIVDCQGNILDADVFGDGGESVENEH